MQISVKLWSFALILASMSSVEGEPFSIMAGLGAIAAGVYNLRHHFMEICDSKYIPYSIFDLNSNITANLFGQPLVSQVIHALSSHRNKEKSQKALTISFHGWPGVGKSFVADMITEAFYKNGKNSKYVKMYSGKYSFPNIHKVDIYREQLKNEISGMVFSCPKSLIIFDEVNDIPAGIIDVIKPMIDYHAVFDGIDYRQAIFIFLSNIGGNQIVDHFLELNKPREEVKFSDFEPMIRKIVYEKGGFEKANIVYSQLIDHYIPFLPLEQKHIEKCIRKEFKNQGVFIPSEKILNEILSDITFGPPHNPIYASAGCKRITKSVAFAIDKMRIKR